MNSDRLKLSEITEQSLSSLVCSYFVCETCYFVDGDRKRSQTGHPCSVCNTPSDGGHFYFHINIFILIDLIQDAFHSSPREMPFLSGTDGKEARRVSVILFFCTLREALLENLIWNLCLAKKLSNPIIKRLLADNRFHIQKQSKLFPSLTEVKWEEALQRLTESGFNDYQQLDKFIEAIVESRNHFVHRGSIFSTTDEMAEDCLSKTGLLIDLYVELHNEYVHSLYMKNIKPN